MSLEAIRFSTGGRSRCNRPMRTFGAERIRKLAQHFRPRLTVEL
jgi:hypothetical protein